VIKLPARPQCPDALQSEKVTKARRTLVEKVAKGIKLSDVDFKGKSYWRETKKALHNYQKGKCCYCERRRDANAEGDVDHFRPKLKVTESPGHSGYWWLAYEWSNYLFSCKACNSDYKKNHFPLLHERHRAATKDDDLTLERPVLIDPSWEEPADFIDYDWDSDPEKVLPVGRDAENRGEETIKILRLAIRDDLHKSRIDLLLTLRLVENIVRKSPPHHPAYREAVQILRQKTRPDQECLGLAYCYIGRNGLQELLDD
jgi:uncharacterized protein (TIGR02646 family)